MRETDRQRERDRDRETETDRDRQRQRQSVLSFGIRIQGGKNTERKTEEQNGGSALGKGRRLPVPNIPGDKWENRSTRRKKPLVRCNENLMMLILIKVSLPSELIF